MAQCCQGSGDRTPLRSKIPFWACIKWEVFIRLPENVYLKKCVPAFQFFVPRYVKFLFPWTLLFTRTYVIFLLEDNTGSLTHKNMENTAVCGWFHLTLQWQYLHLPYPSVSLASSSNLPLMWGLSFPVSFPVSVLINNFFLNSKSTCFFPSLFYFP